VIEGAEVAPGAWVLENRETGRNMGVVLDKAKLSATLVNPGHLQIEQDALEKFLADMKSKVQCLLFTGEPADTEVIMWPGAAFITPTSVGDEMDLRALPPGWEAQVLSRGAFLGLYGNQERTLFCGEMLRKGFIPELKRGSQNYLDALDKLEELDVKLAIPLSGPEARGKREIRERIEHDRNYTMSVLRHVVTSRASHASLERVLEVASQVYEDYPHLETHLRNLRYTWEELAFS
jgi:hypothetical protein